LMEEVVSISGRINPARASTIFVDRLSVFISNAPNTGGRQDR
jgi:hypothetical protein